MLSAGKGIAGKSHGKSAPYRLRPGNGRPARGHTGVTDAVCREGPRHPPSGTCSQTVPPFADALNHLRMKGYDLIKDYGVGGGASGVACSPRHAAFEHPEICCEKKSLMLTLYCL